MGEPGGGLEVDAFPARPSEAVPVEGGGEEDQVEGDIATGDDVPAPLADPQGEVLQDLAFGPPVFFQKIEGKAVFCEGLRVANPLGRGADKGGKCLAIRAIDGGEGKQSVLGGVETPGLGVEDEESAFHSGKWRVEVG